MSSQTSPSPSPSPSAPAATAGSGCTGDTTIYSEGGLIVPFKNLCGTDIAALVDFDKSYSVATFTECLARCVEKQPLCYGFDFRAPGAFPTNCWLKNATFDEGSAVSRDFAADAAMLGPDVLKVLADDCRELGLAGCYGINGAWKKDPAATVTSETAAASASSSTAANSSAASSSTGSASSNSGLSTGASVGIGVGVGVVVLGAAIFGLLFLLRRRRKRALVAHTNTNTGEAVHAGPGDSPGYAHVPEKSGTGVAEMYAQQNHYHTAELESPDSRPVEVGVHK